MHNRLIDYHLIQTRVNMHIKFVSCSNLHRKAARSFILRQTDRPVQWHTIYTSRGSIQSCCS